MYEEVLKYGSLIVDALRSYSQPVFIYLPPNGELRGGAWVVVDPTINISQIEMFADPESRWELVHFVTFNPYRVNSCYTIYGNITAYSSVSPPLISKGL